jgi:hypothetical protein
MLRDGIMPQSILLWLVTHDVFLSVAAICWILAILCGIIESSLRHHIEPVNPYALAQTHTIGSADLAIGVPNAKALKLWKEKLDTLQVERAIATDASEKFKLDKNIEEAEKKIAALESTNRA